MKVTAARSSSGRTTVWPVRAVTEGVESYAGFAFGGDGAGGAGGIFAVDGGTWIGCELSWIHGTSDLIFGEERRAGVG
ncbi:MAG TPA: hypothetical protein VIY49_36720 [Bryobacteraceae bacterium]